MTREEQKFARELKKPLAKTCKEVGKKRGWKTIAGEQYQVREGMLYVLMVTQSVWDCHALKANLYFKPVALDEIYWEVFQMADVAAEQPFSFHVRGAFTARGLWLPNWQAEIAGLEELEAVVEGIFDQAEEKVAENQFPDIASFRRRLEEEDRAHHALSIILCLLLEEKYPEAMEAIQAALDRGDRGSFSRENGRRSIMEDARDWCAARL